MKTKVTAKEAWKLPISKKAYDCFVERIIAVCTKHIGDPSSVLEVFDKYLAGERENLYLIERYFYLKGAYSTRIAFEMLRPEIDRAIERSQRARERALARKKKKETAVNDNVEAAHGQDQPQDTYMDKKDCASGVNPPDDTVCDTGDGMSCADTVHHHNEAARSVSPSVGCECMDPEIAETGSPHVMTVAASCTRSAACGPHM